MSRRRALRVDREERADTWWFLSSFNPRAIPRDYDACAVFHYVSGTDDNDPAGIIECSDGAVFISEDVS